MELPKRKRIRLAKYDYSANGVYFITICSQHGAHIFGEVVVGQGLCSCLLSDVGMLVKNEIINLETRYTQIHLDQFIIMPNHIHLLLRLVRNGFKAEQEAGGKSKALALQNRFSISDVVCTLKSITTKRANQMERMPGRKLWQYRFHDHIVRNEQEYQKIAEYINANPSRWEQDRYYKMECGQHAGQ